MKNVKIKETLTIVLALSLLIVVIGISYAAYTYSGVGQKANTITTGAISMTYTLEFDS